MKRSEVNISADSFTTAIAVGGFFIAVGLVFALNQHLFEAIVNFFKDITLEAVPLGAASSNTVLPAPENPFNHIALYNAVFQFDIAFGIVQLFVFGLRVWARLRINRIAEALGDTFFWLGAATLVNFFLLKGTLVGWFEYWAALIIVIGVSFIARALVYFVKRK